MLDDQAFQLKADEAIESLYDSLIEASDTHEFETDMNAGALTVEFEEPPGKFVVSPNSPVKQIWVSALSKSFKLEWQQDKGTFILPDTGEDLRGVLSSAITQYMGEEVKLS
jgi:CyaY protein